MRYFSIKKSKINWATSIEIIWSDQKKTQKKKQQTINMQLEDTSTIKVKYIKYTLTSTQTIQKTPHVLWLSTSNFKR